MPKRMGSPMTSEESKKTDVKESPKSTGTLASVNEKLDIDLSTSSPTKAELMEDLEKLGRPMSTNYRRNSETDY